MAEIFGTEIIESSTRNYTAVLLDEDGNAVDGANLVSLVLTWYDRRLGTTYGIVNSRDGQDVKNTNNVSVDGSGNLLWYMQREDTALVVSPRPLPGTQRVYRADFTGEWNNGAGERRRIVHTRDFLIRVEPGLPAIA